MGYFSRDEFTTGLMNMGVASVAQLKKALPQLEVEVKAPHTQRDFYGFAFKFCLTVS